MKKQIKYRYHIIELDNESRSVSSKDYYATVRHGVLKSSSLYAFEATEKEAIDKVKQKIDEAMEKESSSADLKREMQRDLIIQDYQYFVEFLKNGGTPEEDIALVAADLTLSMSIRSSQIYPLIVEGDVDAKVSGHVSTES